MRNTKPLEDPTMDDLPEDWSEENYYTRFFADERMMIYNNGEFSNVGNNYRIDSEHLFIDSCANNSFNCECNDHRFSYKYSFNNDYSEFREEFACGLKFTNVSPNIWVYKRIID